MKKLLKRNQVIIYVIAIMLMTAGYLNYTTNQDGSLETSMQMEAKDDTALADVGDATLVSSNDILGGNTIETNTTNNTENQLSNNIISTDSQNISTNGTAQTNATASPNKDDYFSKSKLEVKAFDKIS